MTRIGQVDAARLYWARLDGKVPRNREARGYRFEEMLPLPIERIHWIEHRLASGSWILVGMEKEAFDQAWSDLDGLVPDRIPEPLVDLEPGLLKHLNLLVGPWEPAPRRLRRERRQVLVLLGLLAAALAWAWGSWARWDHSSRNVDALQARLSVAYERLDRAVPGPGTPGAKLLMAERALDRVVHRGQSRQTPEAWELIEAVLLVLPAEQVDQVTQLHADRGSVRLTVRAPSLDACQDVLAAIRLAQVRETPLQVAPLQAAAQSGGHYLAQIEARLP